MRKFLSNKHGDMNMILSAIVLAIVLGIGIIIVFNVFSAIDTTSVDTKLKGTRTTGLSQASQNATNTSWNNTNPAGNATDSVIQNTETFFTIAPILLIVVAAVGILSYVLLLRRTK